jgi:hypothetical protein
MNNTNKKLFTCNEPDCDYVSTRKFNLERHELHHCGEQINYYWCLACDEAIKDSYNVKMHRFSDDHCENVRENFPECCKVRCCSILGVSCLLKVQKKYVNKYIIKKKTTTTNIVKINKPKTKAKPEDDCTQLLRSCGIVPVDDDDNEVFPEPNDYDDKDEEDDYTNLIQACKKKIESMMKEIDSSKLKGLISKRIVDMKQWTDSDESTYFKYNDLESQMECLI